MDLIVSLAIFLIILISATYLLSQMRSNMDAANQKNALSQAALSAFDSLAYSPGSPSDWTPASVSSIGLSFGGGSEFFGSRIDAVKLLRFAKLNYTDARYLLGLGAFDFSLSFREAWNSSIQSSALVANAAHSGIALEPIAYFAASDRDGFALLNGKNVSWDYYWTGDGAEPPAGDAARFYSAAQYGGKAALFNAMLENASASRFAYRTIIVEQPNFTSSEFADVNATALRSFLKARGLLIFEGSVSAADAPATPLFLNSLNETFLYVGGEQEGVVNATDVFIDNASVDDAVSFTQSSWAVYGNESAGNAPLFVFVNNASNASLALVARWDCEKGRVYYVADFDSVFGEGGDAVAGSSVFNVVGARLDFGFEPESGGAGGGASAGDSFVLTRPAIIQRDWGSVAAVRLIVWRTR